jgi:hypothetical protein
MELGSVSFVLKASMAFQVRREDSVEPPALASKSSVSPQKIQQNDSTNLTMSFVCIHVTDSVAFSRTEPLSLGEETERH